jgi:hypothetical protein
MAAAHILHDQLSTVMKTYAHLNGRFARSRFSTYFENLYLQTRVRAVECTEHKVKFECYGTADRQIYLAAVYRTLSGNEEHTAFQYFTGNTKQEEIEPVTSAIERDSCPMEILSDISRIPRATIFVVLENGLLKDRVEGILKSVKRPYHNFTPPKLGWPDFLERWPTMTFEDFCLTDPALLLHLS